MIFLYSGWFIPFPCGPAHKTSPGTKCNHDRESPVKPYLFTNIRLHAGDLNVCVQKNKIHLMQQTMSEFLLVRVMRSFITNVQELPVPKAGHASSLSLNDCTIGKHTNISLYKTFTCFLYEQSYGWIERNVQKYCRNSLLSPLHLTTL